MPLLWPLCFNYSGNIIGAGYIARVEFCGRMLAVPESQGVWIYGVTPGALAASAPTLDDATAEMRDTITKVLVDFSSEARTFDEFHAGVVEFFNSEDQRDEWEVAVGDVTSGKTPVPNGMRRRPNPRIFIQVTRKLEEQLTPADNPIVLTAKQPAPEFAAAA